MFGILLIDKHLGVSSHDVVNGVRRRLGTRRVGHAGTLDPLATGLLVVAVGPATRFLQYLPLEPKVYEAEVTFGRATTTYDAEGESTFEADVPADLGAAIEDSAEQFRGLISQQPPMYSAVKVAGRPLYSYARKGQELEREWRTVHIGALEVRSLAGSVAKLRIECSGGTYIRSLAHDLGRAIGCGAFLSGLVRTNVGRFDVRQAMPLDEIGPERLIPLREALPPMPMIQLDAIQTTSVREGRSLAMETLPEEPLVALLDPSGEVFSVARADEGRLQPECVIPAEVAPVDA